MKTLTTFLANGWGILLLLLSLPISEFLFGPGVAGLGYGFLWQAFLGLYPAIVSFLMLAKQGIYPGARNVAGLTYLAAGAYAAFTIWADTKLRIITPGMTAPEHHYALVATSALSIIVAIGLFVFHGSTRLRNSVLLWLKHQEWYSKIMDNRIDMNADGLHGLNWLMTKKDARKKFKDKCGMILGTPNSPDPLWMVALELALSGLDALLGFLTNGLINLTGSTLPPVDPIYYPMNKGMTILIGPPRTGKATSYAIVNLLNWASGGTPDNPWVVAPFFVLDPKGELFAMTGILRTKKGRRVIPLDFLNVLSTGFYAPTSPVARKTQELVRTQRWRCNPFDFIVRRPSHFEASMSSLIDPLFPMSKAGGGGDDYWNNASKKILLGFWAFIVDSDRWYDGTPFPKDDLRRNPATAIDFLALPPNELEQLRDAMASGTVEDSVTKDRVKINSINGFDEVGMGLPRRLGNELERLMKSEKQWASLADTIQVNMKWCDQAMRESMQRSGCSIGTTIGKGPEAVFKEDVSKFQPFNYAELWKGDTDVYLIVPDDQLERVGPWLRMMVCGLANVVKNNVHRTKGRQFCYLLDELAQVGGIEQLKGMAAYAAGKGIHVVMIFQALAQMKEQYGQDGYNTLLACSFAKIFLGAAESDTAEHISKTAGKTTAQAHTTSRSGGMGQLGGNVSESLQTAAVDVLNPQKILGTSTKQAYAVFSQEKQVLLFDKNFYYDNPDLKEDGAPIYPEPNPFDIARIREWEDKNLKKVNLTKAA